MGQHVVKPCRPGSLVWFGECTYGFPGERYNDISAHIMEVADNAHHGS